MPNIKALSQMVQKLWPMLKLFNQQTNQQTDRAKTIRPRYPYRGHKKVPLIWSYDNHAVSDWDLCCMSIYQYITLSPYNKGQIRLQIHSFWKRALKALIRLQRCPSWSEPSLSTWKGPFSSCSTPGNKAALTCLWTHYNHVWESCPLCLSFSLSQQVLIQQPLI